MRFRNRRVFGLFTVIAVAGAVFTLPSSATADEGEDFIEDFLTMEESDWLYSESNRLQDSKSCWSKAKPPRLEARLSGRWVTIAEPKKMIKSPGCPGGKKSFRAVYRVNPKKIGFRLGDSKVKPLRLRSIGTGEASDKSNFKRSVWKDEKAFIDTRVAALDAFNEALENAIKGRPDISNPNSSSSSSGWSGCYYNGQKMWGRVKVVEYGLADYDVYVTNLFPDLKVQPVDYFATSCGKWQFIEYGIADFTIKYTNSSVLADFSIKFVDYFPGR